MKRILFKGVLHKRFETKEQKKKRIQEKFLNDYKSYQLKKQKKVTTSHFDVVTFYLK